MRRKLINHRLDLVIFDLLLVNLGLLLFVYFNTYSLILSWQLLIMLIISSGLWVVVSIVQKIYKWKERLSFEKELPVLSVTTSSYFSLFFVSQQLIFPSLLMASELMLYFVTLTVGLPFIRLMIRKSRFLESEMFNYIIVGGKESNIKLIFEAFRFSYRGKSNCLGRFGNNPHHIVNHLGIYEEIIDYIKNSNNLDKVYYVYSDLDNRTVNEIMMLCQVKFIDFEVIPRETDLFPRGIKVEFAANLPILLLREVPLFRLRNKIIKRIFDLLFSILVILLIFPWLIPLIAMFIKLESEGPIFFVQDRSGYKGSAFPCFKFRTMTINNVADKTQATKNDSRITRVGAFLRKTSLDELPQFFNVLLGQMSVVGPRPHMLKHTKYYSNLIDIFMIRHQVKPGITGWAQVNGYRGPTEELEQMENRVKYDVWYVENWNFLLDIKCIFHTVINVFKGEENAF